MVTVYLVDNHTRLHLPSSAWAANGLDKLRQLGYTVERTDQSPVPDTRDGAELERRDALIAEAGLS